MAVVLVLAACNRSVDIPPDGPLPPGGGGGGPEPVALDWRISGEYNNSGQRIKQIKFTGAFNNTYSFSYKGNNIYRVTSANSLEEYRYNEGGDLVNVTSLIPDVSNNYSFSTQNNRVTARTYSGKNAQGLSYNLSATFSYEVGGKIAGINESVIFTNGGIQKTYVTVLAYTGSRPSEIKMEINGLSFGTPISQTKWRKFEYDQAGNVTGIYEKLTQNGPWITRYKINYDSKNDEGFLQAFVLSTFLKGKFSPAESFDTRILSEEHGAFYADSPPVSDLAYYDYNCAGQSISVPRQGKNYKYTFNYNGGGLPVSGTINAVESSECTTLNNSVNWSITYEKF